jgi:hypothetical protein
MVDVGVVDPREQVHTGELCREFALDELAVDEADVRRECRSSRVVGVAVAVVDAELVRAQAQAVAASNGVAAELGGSSALRPATWRSPLTRNSEPSPKLLLLSPARALPPRVSGPRLTDEMPRSTWTESTSTRGAYESGASIRLGPPGLMNMSFTSVCTRAPHMPRYCTWPLRGPLLTTSPPGTSFSSAAVSGAFGVARVGLTMKSSGVEPSCPFTVSSSIGSAPFSGGVVSVSWAAAEPASANDDTSTIRAV